MTATTIRTHEGRTFVQYHNTIICSFTDKEILLDTDGWFTATTKKRMNMASQQFNLGFVVSQRKGEWVVEYKGETLHMKGTRLKLRR